MRHLRSNARQMSPGEEFAEAQAKLTALATKQTELATKHTALATEIQTLGQSKLMKRVKRMKFEVKTRPIACSHY